MYKYNSVFTSTKKSLLIFFITLLFPFVFHYSCSNVWKWYIHLKYFGLPVDKAQSRELNSECWRQDRKLKSRWSHHKSKNFYKQCCLFAAFLHQSKKSFFDNKQSKNITVKQKNDRPIFLDILHTNFMAVSFCTLEKFSV